MSYVGALDVSRWQGTINWPEVPQRIVMMKLTGGDNGLYLDPTAYGNYTGAKAAGKSVGQYHFAGGGDPVEEADYFYKMGAPWEQYDVAALDWEIDVADPVSWISSFVTEFHTKAGFWPLVYMDQSRLAASNWITVFNTCGLWLAAPSVPFDTPVNTTYTYVMQQGPIVSEPGVSSPVDTDAWYGTLEQFHQYGYLPPLVSPPVPTPGPTIPATPPNESTVAPPKTSPPSTVSPPTTTTSKPSAPTTPIDVVKPPVEQPVKQSDLDKIRMEVDNVIKNPALIVRVWNWFQNLLDGKKTYGISLAVIVGSVADYFHGHSTFTTWLSSSQGVAGQLSVLLITLRAALAKVFKNL